MSAGWSADPGGNKADMGWSANPGDVKADMQTATHAPRAAAEVCFRYFWMLLQHDM
jgi:hypothetical protein